eukprot:TRINITY_DN36797_c0_g3_i1.p1 TRINITY_DN36797_c0_g3~~TRINITY_DN36797_c0_g3_i1.p1  ORF type:complete len:120 (+),score=4.40 TRINITY_DN36797_c0_g3_i1:133-492(+)
MRSTCRKIMYACVSVPLWTLLVLYQRPCSYGEMSSTDAGASSESCMSQLWLLGVVTSTTMRPGQRPETTETQKKLGGCKEKPQTAGLHSLQLFTTAILVANKAERTNIELFGVPRLVCA